jgi:[ribosomal protein S5]-alanine N-acetyltransferase
VGRLMKLAHRARVPPDTAGRRGPGIDAQEPASSTTVIPTEQLRAPMGAGATRLSRLALPITTPRLVLRLPSNSDVRDLRRSFRDPRTARAVGAYLHSSLERRDPVAMVARTRAEYRRGEHLSLSVVDRGTSAVVGRVGLRGLDWTWRKVESLSYWIDPAWWNHGYATEASWFLCRQAFQRLGMRRIASQALTENAASIRVLRKLGFVEEGREREAISVRGRTMDMILFGLFPGELRPLEQRSAVGGRYVQPGRPRAAVRAGIAPGAGRPGPDGRRGPVRGRGSRLPPTLSRRGSHARREPTMDERHESRSA